MQIWKFTLKGLKKETVKMPKGAVVLSVQVQMEKICVWAEVSEMAIKEDRIFETFGTGDDIPCGMGVQRKYVGTIQDNGYVGHVYERMN